jgi:hydroxyethylthiazole kinase-like uncharacterized protein yjeF
MENVFFNDEVLEAEKKIITNLKIPSLILMENAGAGSADHIINNYISDKSREAVVICGKGSNAGDGFVIARHLSIAGVKVKVLTLFRERDLKGDALTSYTVLKSILNGKIEIVYCKSGKEITDEIKK